MCIRDRDKITIDDVTLDPVSRQVFKDGHQINLTVKEFDLLMELVGNKNVALSRARPVSYTHLVWKSADRIGCDGAAWKQWRSEVLELVWI